MKKLSNWQLLIHKCDLNDEQHNLNEPHEHVARIWPKVMRINASLLIPFAR